MPASRQGQPPLTPNDTVLAQSARGECATRFSLDLWAPILAFTTRLASQESPFASSAFGKRIEYWIIGGMKEGMDVYIPC